MPVGPGFKYKWIGVRFGSLVPFEYIGYNHYRCRCDCGDSIDVFTGNLTAGNVTKCAGCNQRHGGTSQDSDAGVRRAFTSWRKMRERCLNSKSVSFKDYGGRGITVCEEWADFRTFLEQLGPRPPNTSLERRNVDVGYSAENCYWATAKQQSENRRPWKHTKEGLARVAKNLPHNRKKE